MQPALQCVLKHTTVIRTTYNRVENVCLETSTQFTMRIYEPDRWCKTVPCTRDVATGKTHVVFKYTSCSHSAGSPAGSRSNMLLLLSYYVGQKEAGIHCTHEPKLRHSTGASNIGLLDSEMCFALGLWFQ